MEGKPNYKTKQRTQLLDYMKTVPGQHITVNDVCDYLHRQGVNIGQTTVYRQMERMVDEGLVQKYVIDVSSPACFEYVPEQDVSVHNVFERADNLMYARKQQLKSMGARTR